MSPLPAPPARQHHADRNADRDSRPGTADAGNTNPNLVRALPAPEAWSPPSWEEVVQVHAARVYRLSYRLTGNQHDAEDLTQDVFIRVFHALPTYSPGSFEGWLYRITTNLFLTSVRRRARVRLQGLAGIEDSLAGREPGPVQAYEERHFDPDIQDALDALPATFRAAVVLCDLEGLTYQQIADVLDVNVGTVRSRIHRGRAQLRAALEHRRPRTAATQPHGAPEPGPRRRTLASTSNR